MDNCYCLIRLINQKNITLYYFINMNKHKGNYPICLTGYRSEVIHKLISLHNDFNCLSINHCLYLGKELYKAELALIFHQEYIQN